MALGETRYQLLVRDWEGDYIGVIDTWHRLEYTRLLSDMDSVEFELWAESDYLDYLDLDHIIEVWRKPDGKAWHCDTRAFWRGEQRAVDGLGDETHRSICLGLEHLLDRRIGVAWKKVGGVMNLDEELTDTPGRILYDLWYRHCSGNYVNMEEKGILVWGVIINDGVRTVPRLTMSDQGLDEGDAVTIQEYWASLYEHAVELTHLSEGSDFSVEMVGNDFELRWWPEGYGLDRTIGNTLNEDAVVFGRGMGNMRDAEYELDRSLEATAVYVSMINKNNKLKAGYAEDKDRQELSPWNRFEVYRDATGEPRWRLGRVARKHLLSLRAVEGFEFNVIESEGSRYGVHYGLGDTVSTFWSPTFATRTDKRVTGVQVRVDHNGEDIRLELTDAT